MISNVEGESLPLASASKLSSATPSAGDTPATPPETGKQLLDRIIEERKNNFVYWLTYRLAEMQNIKDRAPTLAPGESKTWNIKGTLSATAEKEVGLYVHVLSSEDFDELKYGDYKSLDDWFILIKEGICGDFDVADSYEVSITGTVLDSQIILK